MSIASPDTFDLAIERLRSKSPIAARMSAADWASVELGLRDRAFFSANVESIATVAQMQVGIDKALAQPGDEAFMSKDRFIGTMREYLGAAPGDSRDLTDLTSGRRLGLIYDFQVEDAQEYGRWQASQDPDILDEFPCQELIRVSSRENPRDWSARWADAGGQFFGGRMIARKDDPIWTRISRFGRPWPPFDFGSGMGIEDIDRDEAVTLGVIEPGEKVAPQEKSFNEGLEASLPIATENTLDAVRSIFGDQVDVTRDGKINWQGQRILNAYRSAMAEPTKSWTLSLGSASPELVAARPEFAGASLSINTSDIRHIAVRHMENESDPSQRAVTALDLQLIPHVWRAPDSWELGDRPGTVLLKKSIIGQQVAVLYDKGLFSRSSPSNTWGVKTLYVKKKGAKP